MTSAATEPDDERLQRAVGRLEQAMAEVAAIAGEEARRHVEAAAHRWLGAALDGDRAGPDADSPEAPREEALREPAWLWSDKPRTGKLRRDDRDGKLFGVCAGIANYCGLEPWVVRCIAIVGVILFNWIVLAAYAVAVFVMDKDHGAPLPGERLHRRAERRGRRQRRRAQRREEAARHQRWATDLWRDQASLWDQARDIGRSGPRSRRKDRATPAESPRQRLRDVNGRYDQLEHRLRRLESEVTSGRFDLHRELAKMGPKSPRT